MISGNIRYQITLTAHIICSKKARDLVVPGLPDSWRKWQVFLLPSHYGEQEAILLHIIHIYQISTEYWVEFLRLISTAFKPKHPLRPTNYQRAICCWWRQLHCQGGQCCWWDIFFLLRYFFFAGIFSFLLRYFFLCWDIFFFGEIFSFFGEIYF